MAIREDIVASAVQFLQDPNVASSTIENRMSFLRSKNLTQEEIDAALARAGASPPPPPPTSSPPVYQGAPSGPPAPYYQQYPQHAAWQPPPPPPRRDWRDWFIMATVVSGVSYGIYALGKRYVMPLVAPPTPEKLEQDKKSIEEQFDRAFTLVEQLSKDTDDLKKAEEQRTERLDNALSELEAVMSDLKSANRRREDDAQRVRDEVQQLKDSIPKAMNNQKDLTDSRLREINTELGSLKTLVQQRMNASHGPNGTANNPLRSVPDSSSSTPTVPQPVSITNGDDSGAASPASEAPKVGSSRVPARPKSTGKASIPAWQMALQNADNEKEKADADKANVEAGAGASSSS